MEDSLDSIAEGKKEIFVIGGAEVFNAFIKKDMVNKIYLTEVFGGENITGDAVFDYKIDLRKWNIIKEEEYPKTDYDEYPFRYSIISIF